METATTPSMTRVGAGELLGVATSALERHGATPDDAVTQATQLVEGELRGHSSHGVRRLVTLIGRMDNGLITSGAEPELTWTAPSALTVDGRFGFGPVVANRALDELLPRAADNGVVVAAIRNSHHLGMLSPYVERIADSGAVGIIFSTSEGLVHPWGGAGALVGTNPIAIGVPSAGGSLSLDMSTGAVSMGKILDHADKGLPLPEGWAVDAEGRPTTDAGAAASGAISPFGGSKGYALGLAFESFVGVLTRTAFGPAVTGTLDTVTPTTKGDVIIVISLAAFGATADDPALVEYLDLIRSSGVGGTRVWVPGDRSRAAREKSLCDGVDVDSQVWGKVLELANGGDQG